VTINTANGPVSAEKLGRTLMHEHLVIGMPGWDSDTRAPRPDYRNMVAKCVDQIQELQAAGFNTLLDPCPSDLGRNAELIGEVAARTGFNIIFAVGLYHEHQGASSYWGMFQQMDKDADKCLADVFINEIENGVPGVGIKPGVIKVATSNPPFSDYEKMVFGAAAIASNATGVPITTHTDVVLGDEQLAFLTERGVPANKIVIGHACGSGDHAYHKHIIDRGAFLGFDRFGIVWPRNDDERIESLMRLRKDGLLGSVVISHDAVFCWQGRYPAAIAEMMKGVTPLHFSRNIAPKLLAAGMAQSEIDAMLIDNPRRYFGGAHAGAPAKKQHAHSHA
jgi:phosphotriesterase-related protein